MTLLAFFTLTIPIAFAMTPQTIAGVSQVDMPPQMALIAYCESGLNQYTSDGSVLESTTHDIGLFQINESWIPQAEKLGDDIFTSQGNTAFALWLYHEHHGFVDWRSSETCWDKQGREGG